MRGVEDLVLAVLGPGLGDHLQLHVSGRGGKTALPAFLPDRIINEVGLNRVHLGHTMETTPDAMADGSPGSAKEESAAPNARPEGSDFTLGKIARVKELLAEAQAEDAAAEDKRALSHQHDLRARRKRIEAGRVMLELEQGGMPRMRIYKEIGISAKEGRHLWSLASFYSGIDAAGLDRREQAGGLMSKNQAEALEKYVPLLNDDEAERLIKKVRDDSQLNDPEFGPDNIAWIARNRTRKTICATGWKSPRRRYPR